MHMETKIQLPRNVQFIYEHSLAREELEVGFGLKNIIWSNSDPWTFQAEVNGLKGQILERAAYAGKIDDQESVYYQLIKPHYQGGVFNRTRSVNQYLTHWIYPYKGKFHPQMIRALINMSGISRGGLIFEPFVGSGTAALEAQLLGMNVVGIDISPLCVSLTKVKTQAWQHADQIAEVIAGKKQLTKKHQPVIHEFFQIAKMVSLSDVANRGRNYESAYQKNLAAMLESIQAMRKAIEKFKIEVGNVSIRHDDVRNPCLALDALNADLVVTSPPYSIALDYVKNDKHALEAMGLDIKKIRENFIGVAGKGIDEKIRRYEKDMKLALVTISRSLKSGGKAIVIVGNVTISKNEYYTTADLIKWAGNQGLRLKKELPKIVFGLYNVMDDEKILFFNKE